MDLNKTIQKSKNKGLFNSLINSIEQEPFKVVVTAYYNKGLFYKAIIKTKDWKEVYL